MASAIIATPKTRQASRRPPAAHSLASIAPCELAAHEQAVVDAALLIIRAHWGKRGGVVFDSPARVKEFMELQLAHLEHEVFAVMFLDSQHQLIAFEQMFRGTLRQTSVHPREVVKRALALNAAAVCLAHNHPSGTAEPSRADEFLTQALRTSLALVDVRVLDHFVVGRAQVMSFAERGML